MTVQVSTVEQQIPVAKLSVSHSGKLVTNSKVEVFGPALYAQLSPDERRQWLDRAREQMGVLSDVTLPARPDTSSEVVPFLHDLLCGRVEHLCTIPPAFPAIDTLPQGEDLSQEQRLTAYHAAFTPDMHVIMGLSGSDQWRVVAEIIRQATDAGARLLLVSPDPRELDSILELLSPCDHLFPIRLLSSDENLDRLSEVVRRLTPVGHEQGLQRQCRQQVQDGIARAELEVQATERQLQSWREWRDRTALWQTNHTLLEKWVAEHQAIPALVEAERQAGVPAATESGRFLTDLMAEQQRHTLRMQELNQTIQAAEAQVHERRIELEKWQAHVHAQEQVVDLKKKRNWLSLAWWKATLHGRSDERLTEFRLRAAEKDAELHKAEQFIQELRLQLEIEQQRHQSACEYILQAEIEFRRTTLEKNIHHLRNEQDAIMRAWSDTGNSSGRRGVWAQQPSPLVVVEEISRLEHHLQNAQTEVNRLCSLRQSTPLEGSKAGQWLTRYANLVSVPLAAIREPRTSAEPPFDLLVCLHTERLNTREFHNLGSYAQRWVWYGKPIPLTGEFKDNQATPYEKLVRNSYKPLSKTPCRWRHDGTRIQCEFQPADVNKVQYAEPLLDRPDVQLLFQQSDALSPAVLQAVSFPDNLFSFITAKRILAQELPERTISYRTSHPQWFMRGEDLVLAFACPLGCEQQLLERENGLQEAITHVTDEHGRKEWLTTELRFLACGRWTWPRVINWLKEYLGFDETGRFSFLMPKQDLGSRAAALLDQLYQSHGLPSVSNMPGRLLNSVASTCEVCWLPESLWGGLLEGPESLPAAWSRPIDLGDPRQRQRLPLALQNQLPNRGVVRLDEAIALVRLMEYHIRTGMLNSTHLDTLGKDCGEPTVIVLAQQAAQLSLLQVLWREREWWGSQPPRVRFSTIQLQQESRVDTAYISLFSSLGTSRLAFEDWLTILTASRHRLFLAGDFSLASDNSGPMEQFLAELRLCLTDPRWLPSAAGASA